ncbi:pyocin protein [Pseudomonas aeruginosa]|nr:pyocin protein [Pseudomonas aeruginosa]ERX92761.1 S-type pyocin protein [Pseudomonas aeruginosa BL25]EZP21114.1 S-type pyocin protein [Pseudomonas aeruginosa BWH050]OFQ95390.1 pyocin protein [Pseudomonas sp. HMSC067G02]RIY54615.1 pyocin protein [Pseudomonas aeruginosa]
MTNNSAPPLVVTRGNDNGYEPGSMVITHVQASGLDIIQYIPGRSSYGTPPFVPPGPSPYVGPGMQEYRRLRDTLDKSHSELKKNLKNKTLKEVDELKSEAGLPVKAVSANDIRDEKSIVDALMDAKAKSLKAIEDRPANLYTASDFPQKSEAMYQNQLLASRKFYGEFLDRHMSELAKAYSADIYKAQIAILKQTSQELESKARSMEAQAQQVTQQLGADFNAITTPTATKVQQRVKAVDASLSQVSTQVSGAVASATQAVQVKTAQAQQQANSQISSSQNLISAAFRNQIALAAQASGEAQVTAFNTKVKQIVNEATAFSTARKQALAQFAANAAAEVETEVNRLTAQVKASPTKAASQAAQATLRQFTESTYAKVNTFAQQTEAALQAKAKEVSAAVAEAQRAATNDLQKTADVVPDQIIQAANTLAMPATSAPLVSVAGFGSAAVETARLAASLTNAVNRLVQIAGSGPGAYVATFAVLSLYSDQAGKDSDKVPAGVRNALALEASALGLPGTADLQSVAKAGGTVDMPVRLTSAAQESPSGKSQIAAMLTNGATVPKGVPVRAATLNAATGRYEVTVPAKSTVPNTPPLILTWTPATPPGSQNPSSTTPVVPQPVPVYEGATITPVQAEPESYPGVPLDLDDLIVIFPVGSGVKPIYIMFNHNPHDVVIDDKIREQIPIRGWTEVEIRDVIGKGATGSSSDKRRPNKTIDGLGRNDSATVYGSPPNGYIVVNDRTGEVIQIADRNDSAWAVDGRIIWRNK